MTHNMINVMWLHGGDEPSTPVLEEFARIRQELGEVPSESFGWPPVPDWSDEAFIIVQGNDVPNFELQDRLLLRLATIDPSVKLANGYCGRFLDPVGTRLAWISADEIHSCIGVVDVDLWAARDELEESGWDPEEEGEEKFEILIEQHQLACLERALVEALRR